MPATCDLILWAAQRWPRGSVMYCVWCRYHTGGQPTLASAKLGSTAAASWLLGLVCSLHQVTLSPGLSLLMVSSQCLTFSTSSSFLSLYALYMHYACSDTCHWFLQERVMWDIQFDCVCVCSLRRLKDSVSLRLQLSIGKWSPIRSTQLCVSNVQCICTVFTTLEG